MDAQHLLIDTHAHLAPEAILEELSPAQALARPLATPHSVAELVAHLVYWQSWFIDRCEGRATPLPAHAADGWPAVSPADWPALRERLLDGLRALRTALEAHDLDEAVVPPIESPMMRAYTYRDIVEHVALHNAHHLGQVVLLRQLLATWPPPAGSYTW
jgi:uncharacterized damage-inducible protein DinB